MQKKRVISILLSLGLLAGALSGCGNDSNPSLNEDGSTGGAVVGKTPIVAESEPESKAEGAQEEQEPVVDAQGEAVDPYGPVSDEVTVVHVGRAESANVTYEEGEDSLNNYVTRYLQEQLNVEYVYDFSVPDETYGTKVAMSIASGEMPDVMNVNYSQMVQLVNADAVEDMTDAFLTYRSPGLKQCFDSTNGIAEGLVTFNGKMMAIPDIQPGMDTTSLVYIRGDWMDELGLDAPETLDDIIDIAKAFLEKNPGGNVTDGIAASKDFHQANGGCFHLNGVVWSQDAYPGLWLEQEDGTYVSGATTPEMKNALGVIRNMVEEGVIDPAFVVRDGDQALEMVSTGQAGIFFGSWWSGQWPVVSLLENADDSVRWDCFLAPFSKEGKVNVQKKNPATTYIVVKKGVSEEVKEAIVKTINYQYDLDQEQAWDIRPNGMDSPFSWHYYPINVLHCDYDAKEKQIQAVMDCIDGKIEFDDLSGDGKTWYNGYTAVEKDGFRKAVETNISTANAWGWARGAWAVQSQADKMNDKYSVYYGQTPSSEELGGQIGTMQSEFFLQVLSGEVPLDDFDDYVERWYEQGGQTITDEVNEAVRAAQ